MAKYNNGESVPSDVLCARLKVIATCCTSRENFDKETFMSIPARHDIDADLVLHEAAERITRLEAVFETILRETSIVDIYTMCHQALENSPVLVEEKS